MAIAWLAKHTTLSATLILIVVLHVCFFPFIWGDKTLLASSRGDVPSIMPNGAWYGGSQGPTIFRGNDMGASGWLLEPDASLIRYEYFHEGHLPLWNPYQSFGAPLAANMQSQPFQPLFFLYSLFPGPRTYNVFILARFLLTGLCTYLYLRLFLGFAPSIAGGIGCMLSGYYILFFNMPHLSVDMLVPAVFLATERLLREQTTRNAIVSAAVTFLCIVGGMPESAFLALAFGGAYFLFRIAADGQMRAASITHLKYFFFVQGMGLMLAAFLLAPFFEYMKVSFDTHQPVNLGGVIPGLQHDAFGLSLFTYLMPGGYHDLRGFMGVVQVLLAVVALVGLRRERVTFFFAASAFVLVLKRYGVPVINWIGYLPFCRFVLFPKYEEALLAFSMAVLCGYGVHFILTGRGSHRRLVAAAPSCVKWWPAALIILMTGEMAGNYIYPVYYVLTRSAGDEANPYRGAPYIDYLKSRIGAHERVFGRQGILHPGWAGSFQIDDPRGLDAMYYRKYLDFVRFFLREEIPAEARGDLVNRFAGMRWSACDSPLKTRLLQLSSVRFFLSRDPYGAAAERVQEIFQQNQGRPIEIRTFTMGGETKAVLYEHPPYERLPFRIAITPASREFSFDVAMQPAVYDGSMPVCGAGVQFRLEVRDSAGRIRQVYERYIDPKHNPAERRWIAASVDLSEYLGQTVELLFTTLPGPTGDTCAAWAGWGDPHFNGDERSAAPFDLVYDRGVKIYEYRETLPRAALFTNLEVVADEAAVLARLGSPSLDIFTTAVVSSAGLAGLQHAERARAATIVSYNSQEVIIDAVTERPALLVLTDTDYPGWNVYVDGGRSRAVTANYLFRGVPMTAGRHLVRFAYEPASFRAGAAVSGLALLCLLGFGAWRRRS
ncbi:MAG TPA: YfhO family protein [Bryobacteraceae bacterium]|nr:YfhO family protein [Bryobacteraceae bacterium]